MHASYQTLVLVFMLSVKALCSVDKPVPRHDPAVWQGQPLSSRGWGNRRHALPPRGQWRLGGAVSAPFIWTPTWASEKQPLGGGHPWLWIWTDCSQNSDWSQNSALPWVTMRRKCDPWQTHFFICKMEMRITSISLDCFDGSMRQCL